MSEQTSAIVSKVWGMCNPLRDDGVSYGDYLEQLTYLIFLKMSDEYSKPPYKKETGIPAGYTWSDMNTLKGAELEEQYKSTLEELGKQGGILGKIFKGASNKISSAAIKLLQFLFGIAACVKQFRQKLCFLLESEFFLHCFVLLIVLCLYFASCVKALVPFPLPIQA